MAHPAFLLTLAAAILLASDSLAQERAEVMLVRVPNGGLQPQVVADPTGGLHLIYFRGQEASSGDLYYTYYTRRARGATRFAEPIRVNSVPGSAIATGTVRGGQLSLGRGGRVHVVWNGAGEGGAGMLYARMRKDGTAFEEQRNLMQQTEMLDGGGTVAADGAGHVYVAWHAVRTGERGEERRRLWVARSSDEGASFGKEAPAWTQDTGACACCSTRALAGGASVWILYRSAGGGVDRDMYLLASGDQGARFRGTRLDPWKAPG